MRFFAIKEPPEELPKVVQEQRRHDRQYLIESVILLGVVVGCTYYIASKLGISPF